MLDLAIRANLAQREPLRPEYPRSAEPDLTAALFGQVPNNPVHWYTGLAAVNPNVLPARIIHGGTKCALDTEEHG